jgi:hypothetical protein
VERYKARLVAKGFMQREGVDFFESFAPTSRHTSLRVLLSLVAAMNLELHQIDIKTAFLNGDIDVDVYTAQPPGFEQPDSQGMGCHLNKTLYGLRQAPRAWYEKLKETLLSIGAAESDADPGLFIMHQGVGQRVFILIWVDDILVAASNLQQVQKVKEQLMSIFEARDLGEARMFVGFQIERNRAQRTLKIHQQHIVRDMVAKFSTDEARARVTPLAPSSRLSKDVEHPVGSTVPYAELVGSLMYLMVCTRPDIALAVSMLARYMSAPARQHWEAAKGVLRYVQGTQTMGIVYGSGSNEISGFADSDYGGDTDSRRSTTGHVFLLNGAAISWSSRLQPTVAVSTAEAEYMAAASAAKEALWLLKLQSDLGSAQYSIVIRGDNQAALTLISNKVVSMKSKHIDIQFHFVRELAARGDVTFQYITTEEQVADVFTKALPEVKFLKFRKMMGISV